MTHGQKTPTTRYATVTSDNTPALEKEVGDLLKMGWQLQGGLTSTGDRLHGTMVFGQALFHKGS